MNLHIITFKFNENYLMDAVELFQNNKKETRKEEGCLQYDLIEDKDNKGTFFLIELWESVEHHNRHNGQDHLLISVRMLPKLWKVLQKFIKDLKYINGIEGFKDLKI